MASLTLRSKPTPLRVADADRFVSQAEDANETTIAVPGPGQAGTDTAPVVSSAAVTPMATAAPANDHGSLSFAKAHRAVVERRTKPARRRTTVYLDLDIAAMLAHRIDTAASDGRRVELSDLVNELLRGK